MNHHTSSKVPAGAAVIGLVLAVSPVHADEPRLLTRFGMEAAVGGGVGGFTAESMTDMTDPGGNWSARLTLGTRTYLAGEVAYLGSAQNVTTLGLDDSAYLLGNGVEGLFRFNLIPDQMWQPYVFVGVAWKRYDVVNDSFNTSSVVDRDNVGEVPVGVGLAMRYEGFVADLRLDMRPAFENDLVASSGDDVPLHNWSTALRVGWEF